MAGSGGKGKISHDLVAVSCAAVLAVYAAGYWRTRDAARRLETQALERRPAPTAAAAETATRRAAEPAAPSLVTSEKAPAVLSSQVSSPQAAAAPAASAVTATATATATASASTPAPSVAPPPSAASMSTLAPSVEASVAPVAATAMIEPAPVVVAAAPESPPAPAGNWRDGTYTGWGSSRHGDIKAQVVIRSGRIVESSVASCETRWPCDVISTIFNQPVEKQSADVDRVSRATESTNAYYYALVDALDDAVVEPPAQTLAR